MGKSLDANGYYLYYLPDNQPLDITPHVNCGAYDYCTFDVVAQKYTLYVTANDHNLDNETPEFCVGQAVGFALKWPAGLCGCVGHLGPAGQICKSTD